jgi:uncharacterized membrane protein YoaK (UPF0700 family)
MAIVWGRTFLAEHTKMALKHRMNGPRSMTKTARYAPVSAGAGSEPARADVSVERENPDPPTSPDSAAVTITTGQKLRDLLLVALTVASGAVDAISYFGLGKIFSAFMTGNLVFLGFGIAEIEGPDVVPVIFALSAFAVGAYIGLRISTLRSHESGWWPGRMSVLLALVAIAEAGFLAVWSATAGHPSTAITDVLIVLFSLAMGIQTAAVRSLGVQGVFTTAGTFTLVAFLGTLAGPRARGEIPRLVGVLVGLVAGAIGGGLLFLHARSYAPALPLVVTILVILAGRTMHRPPRRSDHRNAVMPNESAHPLV